MKAYKLEKEERDVLSAYEKDQLRSTKPTKAQINQYAGYASATLKKNQRINIRISQSDLKGIQAKALQEGLPYQTLIASILHKYVSGHVIVKHA